jgi:hypothetical protein
VNRSPDLHRQTEAGQCRDSAQAGQPSHHPGPLAGSGQLDDRGVQAVAARVSGPDLDEVTLCVEDRGLTLIDGPQSLLCVELLDVHASQDRVPGCADAAFPVPSVETLSCIGEVADHGAMIVGRSVGGQSDNEGERGGLLPWGEDLVHPCLSRDGEVFLPCAPDRAVGGDVRPRRANWLWIHVLEGVTMVKENHRGRDMKRQVPCAVSELIVEFSLGLSSDR